MIFIVWIGRYGAGLTGHSQVDDDDADGFQDEMSEMEMDLFRVRARDDYGHDEDDSHGHGHAEDGIGDADGNVSVVDAAGHFATTRTRNAPSTPRSRPALQELASEASSTDQNADVYVKHAGTHHLLVCFAAAPLALC
jgi:hypothetical protein